MGWLSNRSWTKASLVEMLTESEESNGITRTCLKYSLKGNVLWSVWEMTFPYKPTKRFIECALLRKADGEWAYKAMSEACGPYYYTCPVSYFDLVPVANAEWREEVLNRVSLKNHKLREGDQLTLNSGQVCSYVRQGYKKGHIIVLIGGQQYTTPKSKVVDIATVTL